MRLSIYLLAFLYTVILALPHPPTEPLSDNRSLSPRSPADSSSESSDDEPVVAKLLENKWGFKDPPTSQWRLLLYGVMQVDVQKVQRNLVSGLTTVNRQVRGALSGIAIVDDPDKAHIHLQWETNLSDDRTQAKIVQIVKAALPEVTMYEIGVR